MNRLFLPCLLLLCLFSSCHKRTSPGELAVTVTNGMWTTSKPVTSYDWFIDGKKVGGGNQAEASDHVFLTLTRHADGIGYVLQFGTASGHGSDTIHYDTSIEPAITMPTNGSLSIEGPTSIFRFQERTPDGHVSKTQELFIY